MADPHGLAGSIARLVSRSWWQESPSSGVAQLVRRAHAHQLSPQSGTTTPLDRP